ncbi:hypothetical protein ASE03_10390 [Kitasatospora sp. Root187]|nr:hypothetical protein ASC99_15120 [Kitasatospora sp. Root107]KRB60768.1 hypothetical protein ASE03_10390 [Kitasatospora sp. Root187]
MAPAVLAQIAVHRLVPPLNRRLIAAIPPAEHAEVLGTVTAVYRRSSHFDAKLAATQYSRALELGKQSRYEEALTALDESVAVRRRLIVRQPHPHTGLLSGALGLRAAIRHELGRSDEVIADLTEALTLEERTPGPDRPWMAGRRAALADHLIEADRPAEAVEPARRAAEFLREHPAQDGELLSEVLDLLARALSRTGRPGEALAAQQELVGLLPEVEPGGPESALPAAHLSHLALLLRDCGQPEEALLHARRSVELVRRPESRSWADDWTAKKVLWNLACVCAHLGRAEETTAALRELALLSDEDHEQSLADRMLSAAEQLTTEGLLEQARFQGELAAAGYRVLSERSPGRYGAGLRRALSTQLRTLDLLGRDAETDRIRTELAGM